MRAIKEIKVCIFVCSLFLVEARAQTRETVSQSTEWFAVNSSMKLHHKFGLAFDGQLRFVEDFESAQHYLRLGGEFYLTPKLSIIPIGYMYVWNFQYGKQPSAYQNNEQRIWQQILYKHSFRRLNFQHRFRMEERFLQVHHTEQDGSVVNEGYGAYLSRIRYRLQIQIPINKPKMESGAWFFGIFDEVFYGWGEGDTYNRPDQNRLYAAIGKQLTSTVRIEGGGFYQMLIKSNGTKQENNIGTLIQFTYNPDFSKQKG